MTVLGVHIYGEKLIFNCPIGAKNPARNVRMQLIGVSDKMFQRKKFSYPHPHSDLLIGVDP